MRLLFINSASYSSEALIREFHRLRPLELLHIVDLMPRFELAGVETAYHDIIAVQQGDYEEVDWNEVEPLDEPTLLGLAECETVFLKALEKNGKFSKLLDRERYRRRRGLPRVDIYATRASYEYRKHLYLQHLRYWKHVIERHRIDLMVATITPQHGYDYIIYRLCQRMGIPVLFYDIGPVDDWMLPKEDIETPDRAVQGAFATALAKYGGDPEAAPLSELTERFYREQTSKTKEPTPYYMDPARTEAFEYGPVRGDWRTVTSLLHDAAAFLKNWAQGGERREAATMLAYGWVLRWRKQRELNNLRRYFDQLTTPPDFSRKYIYVPLHFQPEITTSPLGGVFAEQQLLVEMLAACVPEDWRIYVKEHPNQRSLTREASFYRNLARLPKVALVPRDTSTYRLIGSAAAVATCTGRAGWEALFRGKPVLAFGETAFAYAPGGYRIRTVEECRAAIAAIARGDRLPSHGALRIFLKALESIAVKGNLQATSPKEVTTLAGITPEEMGINMARDLVSRFERLRPPRAAARAVGGG